MPGIEPKTSDPGTLITTPQNVSTNESKIFYFYPEIKKNAITKNNVGFSTYHNPIGLHGLLQG
jgi:hypothetical protein